MDFTCFSNTPTKNGLLGVSLQNFNYVGFIIRFLGVNSSILKKIVFCVLKAKRFRKICEIHEKSVNSGFFIFGESL